MCIFIVWRLAERGFHGIWIYMLLTIGIICLVLDRFFKPWEHYRMRKQKEETEGGNRRRMIAVCKNIGK